MQQPQITDLRARAGPIACLVPLPSGTAWHDGIPLTGHDLVFTAQLARDKSMPWIVEQAWSFIDATDAPDASTFRITWKQPYIRVDQMFGRSGVSAVYPKHILEEPYTRG